MKFYAFLADGFETVEALAVIDILRRGGVDVCTVSVKDTKTVTTAQRITLEADALFDECNFDDADMLFLPGGMPGTTNLEAHKGLSELLEAHYAAGKHVAAICAAPSILGHHNFLQGKQATCFPGFEEDLYGADVKTDGVVVCDNIITSKGMGKSIDLGLKILEILKGAEISNDIKAKIQY